MFGTLFKKTPVVTEAEKPRLDSNDENSVSVNPGDEQDVDPLDENLLQGQDHVHYETLNWFHCGVLMIAECISLGILSLPAAMAKLGLIP